MFFPFLFIYIVLCNSNTGAIDTRLFIKGNLTCPCLPTIHAVYRLYTVYLVWAAFDFYEDLGPRPNYVVVLKCRKIVRPNLRYAESKCGFERIGYFSVCLKLIKYARLKLKVHIGSNVVKSREDLYHYNRLPLVKPWDHYPDTKTSPCRIAA